MASDLPPQHRGLVLESVGSDFKVKTLPTPQPVHGSAVVRTIAAGVISYHREIYGGQRQYPFPTPLVCGSSAVGRIVALGPDATAFSPGKLVYVDTVIRARDSPTSFFLTAIHHGSIDGSRKLNCIPLDEETLCRALGYSHHDLAYLAYLLVPYVGLRDIKIEPGETVVVCPATGGFGGAGVEVAISMGAKVIAMGRNEKELARLKAHAEKGNTEAIVETVKLTGDEATDTAALQAYGPINAILDLSPPAASKSTDELV